MRLFLALALLLPLSIVPTTALAQEPLKEWTLLVFLNGHNNLDSFGAKDINEMEQIGSTEDSNIVVQWASLKAPNTKRLLVKKDQNPQLVTSPVIENLPRVDMGDYRELVEFIRWGVKNFPAKHYFIDVWNHGSGWDRRRLVLDEMPIEASGISYDDLTGSHITTKELALAMKEASQIMGQKVDIYASDACLMAMAEIAFEMKDDVAYFGGSEETEPGDGWAYELLLPAFKKGASGKDVLTHLAKTYVEYYKKQGQSRITFSAFDLSKADQLAAAVKDFGLKLKSLPKKSLQTAAASTSRFADYSFADLLHFAKLLKLESGLQEAMSTFVFANEKASYFVNVGGVSIWLPTYQVSKDQMDRYQGLLWHQSTGWGYIIPSIWK